MNKKFTCKYTTFNTEKYELDDLTLKNGKVTIYRRDNFSSSVFVKLLYRQLKTIPKLFKN
jgi:hypothetical protein